MNDMRLGDLDVLKDVIERTDWYRLSKAWTMVRGAVSGDNAWYREGDIFKALDEAPTIDAVEVVRCKDCKYSGVFRSWFGNEYVGCCLYPEEIHSVDPEHFCSYGKRKDGDTNG